MTGVYPHWVHSQKNYIMSVFFHKIPEGSNTIVCKSAVQSTTTVTVETPDGPKQVKARDQQNLQFGLLCLVDIDPRTLKLKPNQELKGFKMSGIFVKDRNEKNEDGSFKDTTLQWVTPE
jgi:hypothetical protein